MQSSAMQLKNLMAHSECEQTKHLQASQICIIHLKLWFPGRLYRITFYCVTVPTLENKNISQRDTELIFLRVKGVGFV